MVLVLDMAIDAGVSAIHRATASKLDDVATFVEESPTFWGHPLHWLFNKTVPRDVAAEQVQRGGSLANAAFAFLETLLLLTRWYFYLFLLYLAVRSFGYIWARVAIGQQIGITLAIR